MEQVNPGIRMNEINKRLLYADDQIIIQNMKEELN
jgi:hypothetical protein